MRLSHNRIFPLDTRSVGCAEVFRGSCLALKPATEPDGGTGATSFRSTVFVARRQPLENLISVKAFLRSVLSPLYVSLHVSRHRLDVTTAVVHGKKRKGNHRLHGRVTPFSPRRWSHRSRFLHVFSDGSEIAKEPLRVYTSCYVTRVTTENVSEINGDECSR